MTHGVLFNRIKIECVVHKNIQQDKTCIFLNILLNEKISYWLVITQWDGSFEHQKHMFNPLDTSDSKQNASLANSEDTDEMQHYTVCSDKTDLQKKKYNFIWKLKTVTPQII